jgi:hypothetical protein
MDFVEQIFHISPDGGNGTLELAIAFAVFVIPLVAATVRRRQRVT